jgi:hypothetical protein
MKTLRILIGASAVTLVALVGGACATSTQSAIKDLPPTATASNVAAAQASQPADQHSTEQHTEESQIPRTKPDDAVKLVKDGAAILIDVRDATNFEIKHAKGALNISFQDIQEGKYDKLPKNKSLILYCT